MSFEGQGHFFTLAQGRVHIKIQTGFSQKLLCRSEPNFVWKGQGHFFTLAQGRVHIKIQTGFSQKLLCRTEPNFV